MKSWFSLLELVLSMLFLIDMPGACRLHFFFFSLKQRARALEFYWRAKLCKRHPGTKIGITEDKRATEKNYSCFLNCYVTYINLKILTKF